MSRFAVTALILAFALVTAGRTASAEILRLKDGSFLQGRIMDSDKNFVKIQRFDTGGVVRLSWMQLTDEDRLRLGRLLGLIVTEDARAVKVDGMRYYLKTGEVLEGVLVSEQASAQEFVIRTGPGGVFKYPTSIIAREEPVKIDILRIYTEDEAYAAKLKADGAPGDFSSNMAFADWCQRIGYYEKEKEHLDKALSFGAPDKSQEEFIKNRTGMLVDLIKDREVLKKIKDIFKLIANKKFGEAEESWKSVQAEFPESKTVLEDREKVAEKIVREKETYLRAVVVTGWFNHMRSFIQTKVREKDLKIADAKKWAQVELSKEILAKLGTLHKIAESEIKDTFDARKSYVYRKAMYGSGTFIVQKSNQSGSSGSSIVDQLGESVGLSSEAREKIKEAFGLTQSKDTKAKKALTEDEWWEAANSTTRASWLTAYYAENSGDIEVVRIDAQPCTECGGKGYKTVIEAGSDKGGTKYEACLRCHGLGNSRVVVYK